jgi:hypothetical protein
MAIEFDINVWISLAQSAPEEFERLRRERIEFLILNGRDTHRLRGLQCRTDMERIKARTIMKCCLKLSSMMWDSFLDFNEVLDNFAHGSLTQNINHLPLSQQAEVIQFRRRSAQ